jgi:hypothetical protein
VEAPGGGKRGLKDSGFKGEPSGAKGGDGAVRLPAEKALDQGPSARMGLGRAGQAAQIQGDQVRR